MEEAIIPIIPSWSQLYTAEQAEKELSGFIFKGPGTYIVGNDTLLVVPLQRPLEQIYHQKSVSPDELFYFYMFTECNPLATLYQMAMAPLRSEVV